MKKTGIILIGGLAAILATSGFYMLAADDVAVITRVYNEVKVKPEKGAWKEAKRADKLTNGDNIKTGEKASAVVKFLDGSILRIRPNSELVVYSDRSGTKINKNVQIDVGQIGFDVRKRKEENFSFSSPTSVASIRGTDGGYATDDEKDKLLINDGEAELENKSTGEKVQVGSGQTAELDKKTGSLQKRNQSSDDQNQLNNMNTDGPGQKKKMTIEVQMPDGTTKTLEIEYSE
ncbi:MAG: FecR family protein [Bacteroidetes bacterium]|nr:FecR family protein [Bacteroidota bacterium]